MRDTTPRHWRWTLDSLYASHCGLGNHWLQKGEQGNHEFFISVSVHILSQRFLLADSTELVMLLSCSWIPHLLWVSPWHCAIYLPSPIPAAVSTLLGLLAPLWLLDPLTVTTMFTGWGLWRVLYSHLPSTTLFTSGQFDTLSLNYQSSEFLTPFLDRFHRE